MGGVLAAVLAIALLGCGGGATPTAAGSETIATTPPTPATAPEVMSTERVAHIVRAIDHLAFLTDIVPEEGEDVTDDFVTWINGEADWVTAEIDATMMVDPAIAEYVAAVIAARHKISDGLDLSPSGAYEFNAEVDTILQLRDRIAATTGQP